MKKILAILLLLVLVVSASGCARKYTVTEMGYYPHYLAHKLQDLIGYYDNIIVGKVKNSNPIISIYENRDEKYEADTLHEVEVEEVIFGKVKTGDTVYVLEDGDNHLRINYVYFDKQFNGYIQTGDYVILFLNQIEEEFKYVVQGEATYVEGNVESNFREKGKYIVEAASDIITLKTYYSTHPLQGRIWLTEDKQIDQERNEALLNWTGEGMEVIRTGETYEQFVARVKDVVANLSPAE